MKTPIFAFSSAVYLIHSGRVLLVWHKRYECWLPVGGELKPGERPADAAVREVEEETGVELIPGNLIFLSYEEHEALPKIDEHGNFNFFAYVESRKVKLSDEHREAKWFSFDKAVKHATKPNVKQTLLRLSWIVV